MHPWVYHTNPESYSSLVTSFPYACKRSAELYRRLPQEVVKLQSTSLLQVSLFKSLQSPYS